MRRTLALVIVVLVVISGCHLFQSKKKTYSDIVKRLMDLESLAVLPEEGEMGGMISSYDVKSKYNESSSQYEDWSANRDGDTPENLKKEGDDYVIAELKGPGSIVRIWSAMPDSGHVKIYIDGSEEPVIDMPFEDYFDSTQAPFNYPQLVYESASGKNNYVPISYQESCKIVAQEGWGKYYQFNYITFHPETKVESFTKELKPEDKAALEEVNDYFAEKRGKSPYKIEEGDEEKTLKEDVDIEAGKSTLIEIAGEYGIKAIKIKTNFADREEEEIALRKLVLQIKWDGESEPSVWAPLGDFFGTTPGVNYYKTLPLGMTEDGFYCYWYMPFAEKAEIEIINNDEKNHQLSYEIVYGELNHKIEELGRFHAKWHGDVFPLEDTARWPDWTVLTTEGKGRFLGMMLHVLSPDKMECLDAAGLGAAWWGEGDEKFFVDGEKFPSTFGTGTEDYFGYAWGNPSFFERPFNSQSMTMNNRGHQTLTRWQIADNVPFHKSFDAYLEKYYPNECNTTYNCVAYWYLAADGKDPHTSGEVIIENWAPMPVVAPEDRLFLEGDSIIVTLTSDFEKYTNMRYTLDSTEPTLESMLYEQPIIIKQPTVLKAKMFVGNCKQSITVIDTFYIPEMRPAEKRLKNLSQGLSYMYYEGDWGKLPVFDSLQPVKTGATMEFLSNRNREDTFAFKYTGYIEVPEEGIYTFYTNSDDGSMLFIGDKLIVENDGLHGLVEKYGQIGLSAGKHPITILYFEWIGGNVIEVSCRGPNMPKKIITPDMLYHQE